MFTGHLLDTGFQTMCQIMGTHMTQAVSHFSMTSQINEHRYTETGNFWIIIRRTMTKVSTVDTRNREDDASSKFLNSHYLLGSAVVITPLFRLGNLGIEIMVPGR